MAEVPAGTGVGADGVRRDREDIPSGETSVRRPSTVRDRANADLTLDGLCVATAGDDYEHLDDLSAPTGFAELPADAVAAVVAVQDQAVRWRAVGGSYRSVADAVTTDTDETLTSASAAFTAADEGRLISGTGIPAGTTIASVTSATEVEMSAAATISDTGVTIVIEDPGQPTASEGMPIAPGTTTVFTGSNESLAALRFVEVGASADVHVTYFAQGPS